MQPQMSYSNQNNQKICWLTLIASYLSKPNRLTNIRVKYELDPANSIWKYILPSDLNPKHCLPGLHYWSIEHWLLMSWSFPLILLQIILCLSIVGEAR